MDEEIVYSSLQEYKEALLEKSKGVFSVFCEVFGEDRCDIQINKDFLEELFMWWVDPLVSRSESDLNTFINLRGHSKMLDIIVYFPEVEISNERDEHHTIRELYVRTQIRSDGRAAGIFSMLRTRYTSQELSVGYKHSHTTKVALEDGLDFTACCLGNSPIRSTLTELSRECDLDRWNVYCLQLDQYVGIESLNGGPYIHMNSVGTTINKNSCTLYSWDYIFRRKEAFDRIPLWLVYKFLMTVDLEFANRDGVFIPKMSALEFALRLTELYKSESTNTELPLNRGVLIGDKLYYQNQRTLQASQIQRMEGKNLIKFKGEEKYLRIDWEYCRAVEEVELISYTVLYPIIESILVYINTLANERQEKWGELSKFYSIS